MNFVFVFAVIILAGSIPGRSGQSDYVVFSSPDDSYCLHRPKVLYEKIINSFSSFRLLSLVPQINDFNKNNLIDPEEKKLLELFLTELQNYQNASSTMKKRLSVRIEEQNFKKPTMRDATELEQQTKALFQFAQEIINMIELNEIPKSLSDEKFEDCFFSQTTYHHLPITDLKTLRSMKIAIFGALKKVPQNQKWFLRYYLAFPSNSTKCKSTCQQSWCMPTEYENVQAKR